MSLKLLLVLKLFQCLTLLVLWCTNLKAENNLSVSAEKAIAVWNCATKSNVIILILFFSASHHVIGLTYLMASSDKFRMEFLLGSI